MNLRHTTLHKWRTASLCANGHTCLTPNLIKCRLLQQTYCHPHCLSSCFNSDILSTTMKMWQMKQRFYSCKIICYPGLKLAMNQTIPHWSYRWTRPSGAERKATISHRLIANKLFCSLKARVSLCSDTGCGGTKRETLAGFKVNGTAKAQYAGMAFKWEGTDFAATGLQHQSHGWWIVTNYFYIFMRILTYSSSSPQAHSFQMYLCQTHSLPCCCPSACEQSSVPRCIKRNKGMSYFFEGYKAV